MEKRRVLFVLPDYQSVQGRQSIAPLSTKQKFQIFTGQTFDPSLPVSAALLAGIEQAGDLAPNYGQGGDAFAQRFGAMNAALAMDSFFVQAAFPSMLHQDPRYFRKRTGSRPSRIWYAISRVAITQTDRGTSSLNISQIGGIAASIAISNAYYPSVNRTAGQSASRLGISLAVGAGLNLLREFSPVSRPKVIGP